MRRSTHPKAKLKYIPNTEGAKWQRKQNPVIQTLDYWRNRMEDAITAAYNSGQLNEDGWCTWARCKYNLNNFNAIKENRAQRLKIMKAFAETCEVTFMSNATFNQWMSGQRKKALNGCWTTVIEAMYKKFCSDT